MIIYRDLLLCRTPFKCGLPMLPQDVLAGQDRWTPDRIVMILECPRCHLTSRWACLVNDAGDIVIPNRRVLLSKPWPIDLPQS